LLNWQYYEEIAKSESKAVNSQILDIEYEEQCTLPRWFENLVPASITERYYLISEIRFPFNDLAMIKPDTLITYQQCKFVRTLRIGNLTLPKPVLDELLKFPRLETIVVTPHHYTYYGPDAVTLSRYESDTVEIVVR